MTDRFEITILVPQTRTLFVASINHAADLAKSIMAQIPGSVLTRIRAIEQPIGEKTHEPATS